MSQSVAEIVRDLFLDFNRDPFKNQGIVENYVGNLMDCNPKALKRACSELSVNNSKLPLWREVLAVYKQYLPKNDDYSHVQHDCFYCGGTGHIREIRHKGSTIYSLNFKGEAGTYYNFIAGRCSCSAGEKANSIMRTEEPRPFIQEFAKKKKVDCSYATTMLCIKMSKGGTQCII